mgnify:CR=1 FL=1
MKRLITCLFTFVVVLGFCTQSVYATSAGTDETNNNSFVGFDENGNLIQYDPKELEEELASSMASTVMLAEETKDVTYGVVNFRTKASANEITTYTNCTNGEKGYINGYTMSDGAYLGMVNGKVNFKAAGVTGLVDASEVQIVDYANANTISCYKTNGGSLYHYVANLISQYSNYYSKTYVGNKPASLSDNATYYSYDGHYFYADFKTMIRDYKNGVYTNAVNSNAPYYNYFQYLPARTKTSITAAQFDQYTSSQVSSGKLLNAGASLVSNQNKYGVNALMMYSNAVIESGWGQSQIAMDKNNLFGHGAADNNPYYGANGYSSVDDCISVDEASIIDVGQNQEVASTSAATWDELKTACQSSGDKVITLTGQSYNANSQIVFGNSATIIGSSDTYITTNNPNLIPFFNSNSNLNITFLNVNFKDSNCKIFIQSAGNNELNNCIFSNITTGAGKTSVVYNTQGLMNLDNCTFTNCHTQYGTITNYGSNVRMNVDNCNFVNNNASVEPGAINNCGILNVTNSMFVGNNATWWAGAIHTHSNAQTRISGSKFIKNHAGWNGGALFTYSKLEVYNSTFDENICDTTTGGGAIGSYNFGSSYNITIENCSFKNNKNTAVDGNGGAITALNGGYLNVHGSNFTNNSAGNGLAICAFNANYPNATGGVPFLQVYNKYF